MNSQVVSKWYTRGEICDFEAVVKPGDRIEFQRGIYSHYAIYMGDVYLHGKKECFCIIHVTTTEGTNAGFFTAISVSSANRCGSNVKNGNLGKPYVESLLDYLSDKPTTKFRINNEKDKKWLPFSASKIILRAKAAINSWSDYDLWANNCEHFTNYCRYDMKQSDQCDTVSTVLTIGVLGAGAALLMSYLGSQQKTQRHK